MTRPPTLVLATTSPLALWAFFRPQIAFLRDHHLRIEALSSPGPLLSEIHRDLDIPTHAIPMERRISPLADLLALLRIWRRLRRIRPAIVHAHTPKAGLLCSVAALLAGVPTRIYTINGLPLATRQGWRRLLLVAAERVTCLAATHVWCVSPSLRDSVISEGLCGERTAVVLGDGGSAGVDTTLFSPACSVESQAARRHYALPEHAPTLLYAGRFVRDKGIAELAAAWSATKRHYPNAHLLMCGEIEDQDPPDPAAMRDLHADPHVHWSEGLERDMRRAYAAADLCVLPTYREGLPTVALECAAMAKPIVATRVTGCVDAILDNVTGLLVPPRDPHAFAAAISRLLDNPELREQMGARGREFVRRRFTQERISSLLLAEYRRLLDRPEPLAAAAVRRLLDIAVSIAALVFTVPVLALASAAILLTMGAPVLFRQSRGGLNNSVFTLVKLRTMAGGVVTPLGRILRASSIDELPQFWNVLRGDMSLVGPRPLLAGYLHRYNDFERRRHDVRPGITGWAQIHGRNTLSWSEKFQHDVWYVENRTLRLDLKILALTAALLFKGSGVRAAGDCGIPEFQGTEGERVS